MKKVHGFLNCCYVLRASESGCSRENNRKENNLLLLIQVSLYSRDAVFVIAHLPLKSLSTAIFQL